MREDHRVHQSYPKREPGRRQVRQGVQYTRREEEDGYRFNWRPESLEEEVRHERRRDETAAEAVEREESRQSCDDPPTFARERSSANRRRCFDRRREASIERDRGKTRDGVDREDDAQLTCICACGLRNPDRNGKHPDDEKKSERIARILKRV